MTHPTNMPGPSHYDEKYFAWQKGSGAVSGALDTWKFKRYTDRTKIVLDFGCGGGFILEKLEAAKKFGVDINSHAREEAGKKGITVFDSIASIPNGMLFDTIISNHALEHVCDPFGILQGLKRHLKKGGAIVFFLPFDDWRHDYDREYDPHDINKHLFTWSPLNIGNLFAAVGYVNIQTAIVRKPWIPFGITLKTYLPGFLFDFLCWLRSMLQGTVEIKISASA